MAGLWGFTSGKEAASFWALGLSNPILTFGVAPPFVRGEDVCQAYLSWGPGFEN